MAKPKKLKFPVDLYFENIEEMEGYDVWHRLARVTLSSEKLVKKGELSPVIAAFWEMSVYYFAIQSNEISLEEYNKIASTQVERKYVQVPFEYMKLILESFTEYVGAGPNAKFGRIFGIEGRGQGKQKSTDKLKTITRDLKICRLIFDSRIKSEHEGKNLSIEEMCAIVSDQFPDAQEKINLETANRAYKKYYTLVEEIEVSLTIGGKASGSAALDD